jgi:flagellar basal-body rod protein FlgB
MQNDLSILKVAGAMARYGAARHATVARNIANADTPGYKAHDLTPFDAMLAIKGDATASTGSMIEMKVSTASPNGNTVALDQQMTMAAEAKMQHETALAIYRKTIDLLRAGIGRR